MTQAIRGGCIIQWPEAIRFVIAVLLPRLVCIIAEIVGISIASKINSTPVSAGNHGYSDA